MSEEFDGAENAKKIMNELKNQDVTSEGLSWIETSENAEDVEKALEKIEKETLKSGD